MKLHSLTSIFALVFVLSACATRQPLTTVSHVNLKRYSGDWYEIAKIPNWFERHCSANASAHYALQPNGTIKVLNACTCENGKLLQFHARARVVPGSENAKLKLSVLGVLSANYWIIGLDEKNYKWALVGEPSRKYLWIIARTPSISDALYNQIASIAKAKGYDTSLLRRTQQTEHCGCRENKNGKERAAKVDERGQRKS